MTTDPRPWWVYVLICQDGRTYTGMALDVQHRYKQHLAGRGALFTRINRPVCIVAAREFKNRTKAQAEELALKRAGRYWIRRWCRNNAWDTAMMIDFDQPTRRQEKVARSFNDL